MRSLYRNDYSASLNDVSFNSLSETLFIEEISEDPVVKVGTADKPKNVRTNYTGYHRESMKITIRFMSKQTDRVKLTNILSDVSGWAKEGWLKVSTRPNQRIYVVCTKQPVKSSFISFPKMNIEFTAYDEAYWQEINPVTETTSGTSKTVTIRPNGTTDCFLEADITNTSNTTVNSVTLTANGQTISFGSLGLAQNKTLKIFYNERHVLCATIDNVGVLSKRLRSSDDDIMLHNKADNSVAFTANASCSVTLYARGLFD